MKIEINKAASVASASISEADMKLINAQALGELITEQVYAFKVRACDDYVDRDHERFPPETLERLAPMFVGKTMIFDHFWSAAKQTARVYETYVGHEDGHSALMAKCYMLRTDSTKDIITAIEGGILREVSVGCALARSVCSICGEDYGTCGHCKGVAYDGIVCHVDLLDPIDAYEMSFVAVPAQPRAGVTKSAADRGITLSEMTEAKARLEIENEKWRFV